MKLYRYVGPPEVRRAADMESPRHEVVGVEGLLAWVAAQGISRPGTRDFILTYVVLPDGTMFVSHRNSEHVACARGGMVLAAGEITFAKSRIGLELVDVSNLSTGYCPEVRSWEAVAPALAAAGLGEIRAYSQAFEFRYCRGCECTCIVKDGIYECPACLGELPREWNYNSGSELWNQ